MNVGWIFFIAWPVAAANVVFWSCVIAARRVDRYMREQNSQTENPSDTSQLCLPIETTPDSFYENKIQEFCAAFVSHSN